MVPQYSQIGWSEILFFGSANGFVIVDTVRRFKGLERSVIVLLATPDLADDAELTYVALSRLRTHLIVFGQPGVLSRLRAMTTDQNDSFFPTRLC